LGYIPVSPAVPDMYRFSAAPPDFEASPSVPVHMLPLLLHLSLPLHPCASIHTHNTTTAHLCDAPNSPGSLLNVSGPLPLSDTVSLTPYPRIPRTKVRCIHRVSPYRSFFHAQPFPPG
jgi:hypothetical protein